MSETVTATSAKAVFVSGGAGFIGSHLAARLLARPSLQRLVIFDNFSSGSEAHLSPVRRDPRLEIVRGDLKEKDGSAIFRSGDNITAVASIGRDLENLKAEVALERGDEFHAL